MAGDLNQTPTLESGKKQGHHITQSIIGKSHVSLICVSFKELTEHKKLQKQQHVLGKGTVLWTSIDVQCMSLWQSEYSRK